jgi:hypothetical protein
MTRSVIPAGDLFGPPDPNPTRRPSAGSGGEALARAHGFEQALRSMTVGGPASLREPADAGASRRSSRRDPGHDRPAVSDRSRRHEPRMERSVDERARRPERAGSDDTSHAAGRASNTERAGRPSRADGNTGHDGPQSSEHEDSTRSGTTDAKITDADAADSDPAAAGIAGDGDQGAGDQGDGDLGDGDGGDGHQGADELGSGAEGADSAQGSVDGSEITVIAPAEPGTSGAADETSTEQATDRDPVTEGAPGTPGDLATAADAEPGTDAPDEVDGPAADEPGSATRPRGEDAASAVPVDGGQASSVAADAVEGDPSGPSATRDAAMTDGAAGSAPGAGSDTAPGRGEGSTSAASAGAADVAPGSTNEGSEHERAGGGPGPADGGEAEAVGGDPPLDPDSGIDPAVTPTARPSAGPSPTANAGTETSPVGALSQAGRGEQAPAARSDATQGGAATTTADGSHAADPLWRQVRRALGSLRTTPTGDQQITIRLNPAELGSVVVRITTGEAGTAVALVADSSAAANQLRQERQLLVSELEENGLLGVAVDVATSGGPDQGRADRFGLAADPATAPGALGGGDGATDDPDGLRSDGTRDRRVRTPSSGLIDIDL